jgi:hypothetical protein
MPSTSSRRSTPSSRPFLKRPQTNHPFWGTRSNDTGFDRGAGNPIAWTKRCFAFPAPRRIRDREHVKSAAKQPCLICGRRPADAHHLRFAQSRALASKVSDEFTVPLCRGHHREVHRCNDEAAWWHKIGIDPNAAARVLWVNSHPLPKDIILQGSKFQNEANSP